MTQSVDIDMVAFDGNPNGELIMTDNRSGSPVTTVLRQAGDLTRGTISVGDIIPPNGWTGQDTLKLSGVENYEIIAGTVKGGSEDVVDSNHSHNVTVRVKNAIPSGRYVSTIKGGSTNIELDVDTQVGHGTEVDYDLGNYSQQSKAKTTHIAIGVRASSSQPTLRVGNADKPNEPGLVLKYLFLQSLALKVYVWFKDTFIWPN